MWPDRLQLIQGMALRNLYKVLSRNDFRVDKKCLGHLAYLGCVGLVNSVLGFIEDLRYRSLIQDVHVEHAPLFVLGIWRSGTTHLHNLLSLDENLIAPTAYQAFYPHHFLATERLGAKILGFFSPSTRPMDNIAFNATVPQEDEIAVAALSTVSPYMRVLFPLSGDVPYAEQDPARLPPKALDEWKKCFLLFLKKLTLLNARRLVLKSPPHMGRLRIILELFPDARFVHIVRNPYTVFLSAKHLWQELGSHSCLQVLDDELLEERILLWYMDLFSLFERDRELIPDGALYEMKFEELEARPLQELEALYKTLGITGFESFKERAETYLESILGYKKNVFSLDERTQEKVSRHWRKAFERYGYSL